jgi:NAD-dependent aldehyde dehydrogenases
VLRVHDSVGVVAIACPDEAPLLSFISLMAPAFIRGNTILIIPSEKYPLPALQLYQVRFYVFLYQGNLFAMGNNQNSND